MVASDNPHYSNVASGYEDAFFYSRGAYQDPWLESPLDAICMGIRCSKPPVSDFPFASIFMCILSNGYKDRQGKTMSKYVRMRTKNFQEHLKQKVAKHLAFDQRPGSKDARFVDIGGGTGNFTQALRDHCQLTSRPLCVDPFQAMLDQAKDFPHVDTLCQGAVEFAQDATRKYDRALLKEVVHHLPNEDMPAMFKGIFNQLSAGGVVLTLTRPQEVDYPLFDAARGVWRANQPPASVYTSAMRAAGLQVSERVYEYQVEMPKAQWLAMVRARFWSTFSHFSDDELAAGVRELEERFQGANVERVVAVFEGSETLVFADRMLFLTGRKPGFGEEEASAMRAQFSAQGVLPKVDALSRDEAEAALTRFQEYENALGGKVQGDYRFKAHLLLPWMWDLIHHPAIVDAVEAVLGTESILCWSTDIFVKEPSDGAFVSWHQDALYVGLDPPDVVTAWLALTPSTVANGCLRVKLGSHQELLQHRVTDDKLNLLLKGQTIDLGEEMDEGSTYLELEPGQISLHHIRTVHKSGPNVSDKRRVGIAIRYMAGHVKQSLEHHDTVTVVRGPPVPYYEAESAPVSDLDEAARAQHLKSVQRVHPDPGSRIGVNDVQD